LDTFQEVAVFDRSVAIAVFDGGTLWAIPYSGIKFVGLMLGNEDYPFVNTEPVTYG